VSDPRGEIELKDGKIWLQEIKDPIDRVSLKGKFTPDTLTAEPFSFTIGGGSVGGAVRVQNYLKIPQLQGRVSASNIRLEDWLPPSPADSPRPSGIVSIDFEGSSGGLSPHALLANLRGEGRVKWREARVLNLNVLRQVFDRLSVIPGIMPRLEARLGPEYLEKLNERDTALAPADTPFSVAGGIVSLPEVRVATETFSLSGRAQLAFDKRVDANVLIKIDPALSEAMAESVEELRLIADAEGRVEIPVRILGVAPRQLVLRPDLGFLASRLAVSKARDVLGGFMQSAFPEPRQPVPAEPVTAQPSPGPVSPNDPQSPSDRRRNQAVGLITQLLEMTQDPAQSEATAGAN
jgi:hypothetical protein